VLSTHDLASEWFRDRGGAVVIAAVWFALHLLDVSENHCRDVVLACRWLCLSHSGVPNCDASSMSQPSLFHTLLTIVLRCGLIHV
jgi:hypothetical protein